MLGAFGLGAAAFGIGLGLSRSRDPQRRRPRRPLATPRDTQLPKRLSGELSVAGRASTLKA